MLSDQELCGYNQQGLIPGPEETEEEFIQRARFCLSLRQELANYSEMPIAFEKLESDFSEKILTPAFAITQPLFDIAPKWIPLLFSNEQMPLWHGGCVWIFQLNDNTPTAALLQLRKAFFHSKRYLGLYDRTEIVAHELSHVGRMLFHEPRFEEVIAYRTSPSRLRRLLGPIIESPKESLLFILLLGILIMADIALIATGQHTAYEWAMWLKAIPALFIALGFWRLAIKQRQYDQCLSHLSILYPDLHLAQAVLYRLTDEEIILFSEASPDLIKGYIYSQEITSLRWRLIAAAYPIPAF